MTICSLARTIKPSLINNSVSIRYISTITPKPVVGRFMSKVARWNECYDDEHEVESLKHKVQQNEKVYEEKEESCWIPDPRTGIYYPKGHEWVMKDVPNGAASFGYNYWFRKTDL